MKYKIRRLNIYNSIILFVNNAKAVYYKYMQRHINILTALSLILIIYPNLARSITTDSYIIDPLNINNPNLNQSATDNYNIFNQQIGDPAAGPGETANYSIRHGHLYSEESGAITINFTYIPEGRYGAVNTNDQTKVIIEIRNVGADENNILFSQETTTTVAGIYTGLSLTSITPGSYDISAKGWANLRIKKSNIVLIAGANTIDFTNGGASAAKAGDINTYVRTSVPVQTVEIGDNAIGAADYSALVSNYLTANERYDLDAYGGSAGAADYSRLISNYGLQGDQ